MCTFRSDLARWSKAQKKSTVQSKARSEPAQNYASGRAWAEVAVHGRARARPIYEGTK
jgi:hypothetical protein